MRMFVVLLAVLALAACATTGQVRPAAKASPTGGGLTGGCDTFKDEYNITYEGSCS